ncbi:MAG TPA: metalloregulator ArsR/SmtB family transcription factor [Plantibacter sp.]|uniref:metalloregulator ArsR/SmtB family transcription factor n=1 Tax=Plantibacter sp. TaxID=1871045 RepID=UPI002C86FE95|nr:metalloregulator ArsR/SmtB family transcription factor [Plantibacter sp.]
MEALGVRAAKFAALAEPARLRIVDLLALGDLSPTEVQSSLGMRSNLVAHHLRVLEQAGILSRSRSEADGRRSYVRLVPSAFDGLTPDPVRLSKRIVFVCTANSARSQMAEALWRRLSPLPVASAGSRPATEVNAAAVRSAARHGVRIPGKRPLSTAEVLQDDDFVIAVCDRAHEELSGRDDLHWSIPDPARTATDSAFDHAFRDLRLRIEGFVARLAAQPAS